MSRGSFFLFKDEQRYEHEKEGTSAFIHGRHQQRRGEDAGENDSKQRLA
jgi:hypothetical protein